MNAAEQSPFPHLEGYTFVDEIGRGSMGLVYAAESDGQGEVAVKVLSALPEAGDMAVERFRREVAVVGRIDHPGVPTVFDAGQLTDGRFYLVMERLHGKDLESWWDSPGYTRAEALRILLACLDPLAAAHAIDVVHRDLKPENLFVEDDGGVRLLDFGVARDLAGVQKLRTATGIAVGTPVYMSPEQATQPSKVGPASDVWSMGVMLYEALCGELPFDGESPHAVVLQACTSAPAPLGKRVPEVHHELITLVHRCLTKDPKSRPTDAGALRSQLQALLSRDDVLASLVGPAATPSLIPGQLPSVPPESLTSSSRTSVVTAVPPPSPWRFIAGALFAVVVVGAAGYGWISRPDEPAAAASPSSPETANADTASAAPIEVASNEEGEPSVNEGSRAEEASALPEASDLPTGDDPPSGEPSERRAARVSAARRPTRVRRAGAPSTAARAASAEAGPEAEEASASEAPAPVEAEPAPVEAEPAPAVAAQAATTTSPAASMNAASMNAASMNAEPATAAPARAASPAASMAAQRRPTMRRSEPRPAAMTEEPTRRPSFVTF
ncbi:MAG: serine/threonine-protein kinase [Myxococcota bacterium]